MLKRKLVGIIFLTSLLVLLLTCLMLFYYEVQSYRKNTAQNLSSIGDILCANSGAILIFEDQKLAQQILSGLQVDPDVTAAAFYTTNGTLFASYPARLPTVPPAPRSDGLRLHAGFLTIYRPILQDQNRVGTLYLKGNLNLERHLRMDAIVLTLVFLASGALGLFLSNLFQRQITQPLLDLAAVATTITKKKDYSVRGVKTSNDEIGDLTEAFNSMLDQIQESHNETMAALRARDDFLAALSHDLRTPLNPVLLIASDAASNPDLPREIRVDFETIRRNVELEARLIDDLLDLTRISRGKLSLNMQPLDVHDILKEAVATVHSEAAARDINLTLELRADRRIVFGDAVRLEQVFWNVLKNAVKFTPHSGKIAVKTSSGDENLLIKISDNGIGMTADELERIFNAFSQGDHAENGPHRFGGLGLGLAISRMLIELHSGSIHAESDGRGKGATFTIRLPLSRIRKTVPVPAETSPPVPARTTPIKVDGPHPRILLVEDHEPTRAVLTQLLVRRHFDVTSAASLAEARTRAGEDNGKFNLVISDIGLPDGNGYDLMAELREHYGLKGIALTGYGMEHDILRSQKAGFVTHLTKPVRIESLDSALIESLNGK